MSGVGGDNLPVYASTSSSSSSSKPRLRSHSKPYDNVTPSPSTRYRLTTSGTSHATTFYPRYSEDNINESSRLQNNDSHDDWASGSRSANPYANQNQPSRSRRRSKTSFDGVLTDVEPTSPFAGLLDHRRRWSSRSWRLRIRKIGLRHVLLCLILTTIAALAYILIRYEPHIEIKFYSRRWIHEEVDPIPPLSGCFARAERSGDYNVTERVWRKSMTWDVHAGLDMQRGFDCYDFSGIVGSRQPENNRPNADGKRTIYHTYWRTDLAPFGHRQEYMLKSFFATQPIHRTQLVLWSNGDLAAGNEILQGYMRRFPEAFAVKQVDMKVLAKSTALDGSDRLENQDEKAWLDGDLLRLLVLYNFGGVWIDMDSLLTRSLEPLLEHEFVTQWDCYSASSPIRFVRRFSSVPRQTIYAAQRRSYALPCSLSVPLRSIPYYGDGHPSSPWFDRLGFSAIHQALEASSERGNPPFQNPTLVLQRRSVMSNR